MTRTISTEELANLKRSRKGFAFLNVLSPEQFAKEHIPGSANAPIDNAKFMTYVEAQTGGDKDAKVVVYCTGVTCNASARAARTLEQAGYNDVVEYSGGMAAWKGSHHQEGSQARPSQDAMASISAAVRAGEAHPPPGQLNLDDEEEVDLAGSEAGAERENWTRPPRVEPPVRRPQSDRIDPPDEHRGRSVGRAAG